eukprot:scaffold327883_cov17-Prasinocladus_malaysianus.AAC.1
MAGDKVWGTSICRKFRNRSCVPGGWAYPTRVLVLVRSADACMHRCARTKTRLVLVCAFDTRTRTYHEEAKSTRIRVSGSAQSGHRIPYKYPVVANGVTRYARLCRPSAELVLRASSCPSLGHNNLASASRPATW